MYSGERGRTTVLRHWGGLQKDEEREGDQIPLGEELLRERDTRQGGKAGMLPRQRSGTENFKGSLSTCVFKTATATGREHFAC